VGVVPSFEGDDMTTLASDPAYDVILVGGGLANGLIADRLIAARPDLRLLVLEHGATLGGNHTWSFHDTDISAAQHTWIASYVTHRWPRQEVRFDGLTRVLDTGYCSIPSERFHDVLAGKLGNRLSLASDVVDLSPTHVTLSNQQRLSARCVIDGRGPRRDDALALGYQKFIGREVETAEPHGQLWPIIMDATVSQKDGYRFVYTLPLDTHRLLIEDTYYSDRPDLDLSHLRGGIDDYARARGWRIARDVREEHGVLPIILAGDMDRFWRAEGNAVPRVGLRAGLFHPTTGYSLPDAARLAEMIAALPELTSGTVAAAIAAHAKALWDDRGFFRFLNRMLFLAASGDERARVLARFYTMPEPLIQRFYAGHLTLGDKARIVTGKPPLPIAKGLGCISTAPAWQFARANGGGT
jgi:lycopene beta-cyclase